MKATYLCIALSAFAALATCSSAAESINRPELDGREVVVKVYTRRWDQQQAHIEYKTVPIKNRMFRLELEKVDGYIGLEVAGRDQKDELVRDFVGRSSHHYDFEEGPDYCLPVRADELEGRQVVVRLYPDCLREPTEFKKLPLTVHKKIIKFTFGDLGHHAFIVLFGDDQTDELIARLLAKRLSGWRYKQGLFLELPEKFAHDDEQDFRWTFLDALGDPVSNALVHLYLVDQEIHEVEALVAAGTCDANGRLRLPFCPGSDEISLGVHSWYTSRARFVVAHPQYGLKVLRLHWGDDPGPPHTLFIPAAPPGSEADRRSIWGSVVDQDGNCLPGIYVWSSAVYPPQGESVADRAGQVCGAVTDEQGLFRFYLPLSDKQIKVGSLVPCNSEYYVYIKPPAGLDILPFSGRIPNGQETVITLERADYFHTFAFQDQHGPITDANKLARIEIWIERPGKKRIHLKYEQFKAGGMFPLGTYTAKAEYGGACAFAPVKVKADEPEEIVFRPPTVPPKLYYGRVLHGVTGEPVLGVKICVGTHFHIGGDPNSKTQTDANGLFELKRPGHVKAHKFLISEPNYLKVYIEDDLFKQDPDGNWELPLTRMFPAAKITLKLRADKPPLNKRYCSFFPEWIVDVNQNPSWAADLLAACIDDYREGILRDFSLNVNRRPESFEVPAELSFQLQLRPWMRVHHRETGWAPMTIADNIKLRRGEVRDLGEIIINRALPVFVDVTNPVGQPTEGVPVTARDQYGRITHTTDENGVVMFEVAHDSKGQFVVEHKPDEESAEPVLREAIPYQISGTQDANSVYTMTVSGEMLNHLFK